MKKKGKRSRRRGEKILRGLSVALNFSSCHEQHMIACCTELSLFDSFLTYFFKLTFSALNLSLFLKALLLH